MGQAGRRVMINQGTHYPEVKNKQAPVAACSLFHSPTKSEKAIEKTWPIK